jgi:hypothetical protein
VRQHIQNPSKQDLYCPLLSVTKPKTQQKRKIKFLFYNKTFLFNILKIFIITSYKYKKKIKCFQLQRN